MAGQQAPPAQPLMPPDQAQQPAPAPAPAPQDQGAGGAPPPPGGPQSGVSSTSDQQRWQQMVQAPFAGIGQPPQGQGQGQGQGQVGSKQARSDLRSAVREGRWDWLHKLAHALTPSLGESPRAQGRRLVMTKLAWGWQRPMMGGMGGYGMQPQMPQMGMTGQGMMPQMGGMGGMGYGTLDPQSAQDQLQQLRAANTRLHFAQYSGADPSPSAR